MAEDRALFWHYCPDTRHCRGDRGWVDLVIIGPKAALFREVKTADGRRTTDQLLFGDALRRAGLDYQVWRPADLQDGGIARELDTC